MFSITMGFVMFSTNSSIYLQIGVGLDFIAEFILIFCLEQLLVNYVTMHTCLQLPSFWIQTRLSKGLVTCHASWTHIDELE